MKNKLLAILMVATIISLSCCMVSCTCGDGASTVLSQQDSLIAIAPTTPVRIAIIGSDGTQHIASVMYYSTQTAWNGKDSVSVRALNYICPCGASGTLLPPYTVDTITWDEKHSKIP
jgi:hypothetical protein